MSDDPRVQEPQVTGGLTCADVAERNLIERYVAGSAMPVEVEAFEAHYLTCPVCQANLRLAAAVRATLPDLPTDAGARRWTNIGWVAVAAIAAVLAIAVLRRAPSTTDSTAFGRVPEAPAYLGIAIRGSPNAADSLFETGMRAYVEQRYGDAASTLTAALAAGVDSIPADFFRATSLLMLDHADSAAAGYARVIEQGASPYRVEAHFYRAKALLRLDRPRDALVELEAAGAGNGEISTEARALADSVRQWLAR
jgi:tetratricopeptide (TPR) repeat protein